MLRLLLVMWLLCYVQLCIRELLSSNCQVDVDASYDVVVYDQCTVDPTMLAADCFLVILVNKLQTVCRNVYLLNGTNVTIITLFHFVDFALAYLSCGYYYYCPVVRGYDPQHLEMELSFRHPADCSEAVNLCREIIFDIFAMPVDQNRSEFVIILSWAWLASRYDVER